MLLLLVSCVAIIVIFQFLVGGRAATERTPWLGTVLSTPRGAVAKRSDLHLRRKLQHAVTGLMIFAATGAFPAPTAVIVLLCCAGCFYMLHALRCASETVDRLYLSWFHGLLRREEIQKSVLPGAFYFLIGCAVVLTVFTTSIARLAILHLSLGDPAASLFGTLYGRQSSGGSTASSSVKDKKRSARTGLGNKSLAGFLGCLGTSAIASSLYFIFAEQPHPLSLPVLLVQSVYAGLCAACAELLDVGWDDNVSLPILDSLMLQMGAAILEIALTA
ncbi:TPA: hypothetical protein N0F65_006037 [Lagenidium giganteum]|uniref:Dolichol kinase n=1 Tax=Lagenidium giganteum TaxID=4803 RepID=A0AAV2Z935_9STRA|nr:TPA: hypothetical protein N0F65_006037 [Lagenidium giganteum]